MEDFHILVVSPETEAVGASINSIRLERGLPVLKILLVPHVMAEDGRPISATRVLQKEIDRNGHLNYLFSEKGVLEGREVLPEAQSPSSSTILVHGCCAGCLLNIRKTLAGGDRDHHLVAYWYNPNIHPTQEYMKRRKAFVEFAGQKKIPVLLSEDYSIEDYLQCTLLWQMMEKGDGGKGEIPEAHLRCEECYRLRLRKTAELAEKLKIPCFTTTLLCSPYQDHELIRKLGVEAAAGKQSDFFYLDFRKDFRKYDKEYKETGLYHQNYCGCLFSEKERFYKDASP